MDKGIRQVLVQGVHDTIVNAQLTTSYRGMCARVRGFVYHRLAHKRMPLVRAE